VAALVLSSVVIVSRLIYKDKPIFTQRINVALGKEAKQSSLLQMNELFEASKAVDGNTTGNGTAALSSTDNDVNAWWEVDLGRTYSISEINIWNRTDCCAGHVDCCPTPRLHDFYVLVSDAKFASTDLATTISQPGVFSSQFNNTAGTPTTIAIGKSGRYVRVQFNHTDYLTLAEVEVFADVPLWHFAIE